MSRSYQWSQPTRQLTRDVNTRQRFSEHQRGMAAQSAGQRTMERDMALEQLGRDFTRAETGAWHEYVTKGGSRPSGFGYGAGGGAPTLGEAPVYEKPEYDEDKVSSLTQKRAAPGVRRLRETTQQAMSATYDNPNVKRMTVRDALSGYGTGLENVMAGAGTTARAEYGQQYAADVNAAMAKYRGDLARQSQEYDIQSRDWLMGRENEYWKERQDYQDPYAAFEDFYR